MAYLALYRKYRPTTFDEVIGQSAIVTTLKNQIKNDKVGHAYLFTGTRGTGKTSTAKIFARAVNCPSSVDGSPCNKCDVCREMIKANNLDIIEIDAASNNKVDEIRELRENVQYPPSIGKRKVYIIDEVHMLTDSAFNALLKTLEEPPEHAVFILATTEAYKVPQTIISRCMRFDFSLVSEEEIVSLMNKILDDNGIKSDPEAVSLVARAGAGSVRDSLSILDKCVSFCENNLTVNTVSDILGLSGSGIILDIAEDIIDGNLAGVLTKLGNVLSKGKSVGVLNGDVLKVFRDILILNSCDNAEKLLLLPKDVLNRTKELALKADKSSVLNCIDILSSADGELRYSINPKVVLESVLIRCSRKCNNSDYDQLLKKINELENIIKSGVTSSLVEPSLKKNDMVLGVKGQGSETTAMNCVEKEIGAFGQTSLQQEQVKENPIEKSSGISVNAIWGTILQRISERPHFYAVLRELEVYIKEDCLVIKVTDESSATMIRNPENGKLIREILDDMGINLKIRLEKNYQKNLQIVAENKMKELFGDNYKKIWW